MAKQDFMEVFSGTSMEAEFIRILLKDSEIESYIKDGLMGTIAPFQVSGGGAGSVKVLVPTENYERAISVVDTYHENRDTDH